MTIRKAPGRKKALRKPSFSPLYAVPVAHSANPYPRPRKALADRAMYPWHDRDAAHRIIAASTRAAAAIPAQKRRG